MPDAGGPAPVVPPAVGIVGGKVVPRGGGDGLPGVPVRILRREDSGWVAHSTVTTGDGGAFRVEGLAGGLYRLIPGKEAVPADERSEAEVRVPADKGTELVLELEVIDEAIAVHVHGTVTFDSGRVPGRFSFDFWKFDGTRHINCLVEGTAGKFTKRLPFAGQFDVTSMKIDGEDHDYVFEEVKAVDGAGFALVVEEAREAGVLVVDAGTGQPVSGARVHGEREEDHERIIVSPGEHNPPGPNTLGASPVLTDASGRVSLGRGRGKRAVWVIADGFAWSRGEVRFAGGEDARVALVPGGTVRLLVADWSRLQDPRIHAWPVEAGQAGEDVHGLPMQLPQADQAGELVVDGMPAGRYLLKVLRGAWFKRGETYGRTLIDVSAGKTTTATIKTTPPPDSYPVDLTLSVGGGWGGAPSSVLFDGVDAGNASVYQFFDLDAPGEDGVVRLRTDPLPPGRYRVEVSPQGWTGEVTVLQGGGSLRLAIPPPGTLRIGVRSSAAGEPVRSSELYWTANPERSAPDVHVLPNDGPGRFRLTVPPGAIRLLVSGAGLRSRSMEVPSTSGLVVERDVVLDASAALTVRFTLDGKPYTGDAYAFLKEKEPPPDEVDRVKRYLETRRIARVASGEATFGDFEPGVWILQVLAGGMKEVPPREVRLEAGVPVQLDVALERRE
jgi:hypothetical protein